MNYQKSHSVVPELNETESNIIRDLELFQKYMNRIRYGLVNNADLKSDIFKKTAKLLLAGILSDMPFFEKELRIFYDKR